jgi:hypothetical protein
MARRQHTTDIPVEAIAPLLMLVEAAAAPAVFRQRHLAGTSLERAEILDALEHGAVLYPELTLEWAMYAGHVPLQVGLSEKGSFRLEIAPFVGMLEAIAPQFPLQFSMPLPPRGKGGSVPDESWGGWAYPRMRVRAANQVQLVDRTVFFGMSFGLPDDVDEQSIEEAERQAEAAGGVPYFGEPALRLGQGKSVGQTWIRIDPEVMGAYRREPVLLFSLLARLLEGRITVLQSRIAHAKPPLRGRHLLQLNEYLRAEAAIHDAYKGAVVQIRVKRRGARTLVKRVAAVANPAAKTKLWPGAPTIFVSYSHHDRKHQVAIREHLAVLTREGRATIWWDERIPVGKGWEEEIAKTLNRASIILLLVSRHFLSSTYCYEREMSRALNRAAEGKADVIPAILAPCSWKGTPLGALMAVPKDGKPVVTFPIRDNAYVQIVHAIELAITARTKGRRLRQKRKAL